MVFFQHVEPGFSRFNGHTPQVIDSGFYTVVAPFVGAAIRNSVEVVFPCRQTVDTSITADLKTSYIPIIGISAKASVEDQINAFNHGADAYIVKPFHPRQVISTIENLLSRQMLLKDYFNSSMSSVKVKDGIVLHPEDEELIQNVTDFIKNNIDDELLSPSSIAEFVGVSKATLYRKFKEIIDKTPSEFVRGIRLEYAAKLLRTTKLTVSEIMFKCGFSNKSYFYREFLKQYGVSPKDYRNQ